MRAAFGLTVLSLITHVFTPALNAQELPFRHYTTQSEINPLPKPAITAVYQDRLGFVWLGTYGIGLVRYDGQGLEEYSTEDGVDANVFGITEDLQGRLWTVSDEGVSVSERPLTDYSAGDRVRFTTKLGGVELYRGRRGLPVHALEADQKGAIWFGTERSGISRYRTTDRGVLEADTVRTGLHRDSSAVAVLAVAARRDGSVWASLRDGRVLVFEDGSLSFSTIERDAAPCEAVTAMYEDVSNALWLMCSTGTLWRLADEGARGAFVQVGEPVAGFVTSMVEASPGRLWLGTLGSGVVEVGTAAPYVRSEIARENGLLDVNVWGLTKDREGNVWIAQNSGLSRLRANYRAFTHYTGQSHAGQRADLPATDVIAVRPDVPFGAADRPGGSVLAVGTSDGLALIHDDGRIDHLTSDQGLPSSAILNICTDASGLLWLTTRDGATSLSLGQEGLRAAGAKGQRQLNLLGERVTMTSYAMDVVSSCQAVSLPADSAGAVKQSGMCFASTRIRCLFAGQWYIFRAASGLVDGDFWRVVSDSAGYLYVGTKHAGLYRSRTPVVVSSLGESAVRDTSSPLKSIVVTQSIFEPVFNSTDSLLGSGPINTILFIEGVVWVSSPKEVVAIEGSPLRVTSRLGQEQSVGSNIFSMAFSPMTRTIWVGSSDGLAEIDPARRTVVRTVSKKDGLVDNETWGLDDVAVGLDGTVYHGSAGGLSLYRPHLDRKNEVQPLLALREATMSQDRAGHNELNLRFAALSFTDEKRVRYRTRLSGFDREWSEETANASIRYTNLPALFSSRQYTFEVVASNGDGFWTESPLTYSISVKPAWWLRWWAFLVYGILLGAGVYAAYRVQHRRVIQKEREQAALRERDLRAEAAEHLANYLQVENERKTRELEQARWLQLSMLPRAIPVHRTLEVAASMQTATEVGGDYYDFVVADDGTLTFAIGDATGHGAAAGTMVTAVKSLWNAFSNEADLEEVMRRSHEAIRSMHLPKLYMALAFGRVRNNLIELVGAGMPPALIYRAETGDVEEVPLKGMPLGSPGRWPYRTQRVRLAPGDTVVLMSDGFPELRDGSGEMLGYDRMAGEVAAIAGRSAKEVLAHLTGRVKLWSGGEAPRDDVTFVVIRAKAHSEVTLDENGSERDADARQTPGTPGGWTHGTSDEAFQKEPRAIPLTQT